jgi:hypothetical protein
MPSHACPSKKSFEIGSGRATGRGSDLSVVAALAVAEGKAYSGAVAAANQAAKNHTCDGNCRLIATLKLANARSWTYVVQKSPKSRPMFEAFSFVDWSATGRCYRPEDAELRIGVTPPAFFQNRVPWYLEKPE